MQNIVILALCFGVLEFLFAYYWAKGEIQIEGRISWAGSLPCWRIEQIKIRGKVIAFKEITGYHANMFALFLSIILLTVGVFSIGMLTILMGRDPDLVNAIISTLHVTDFVALIALMISCASQATFAEDFMWNAIHPSKKFGLGAYSRRQFPAKFIFGIPVDYIMLNSLSLLLFYSTGLFPLYIWIINSIILLFAVALAISFEQWLNVVTKAAERIEKHVKDHNFLEGGVSRSIPLFAHYIFVNPEGNVLTQKAGIIETIPSQGRYDESFTTKSPDWIENRLQQEG
jgi:hypothetical protein